MPETINPPDYDEIHLSGLPHQSHIDDSTDSESEFHSVPNNYTHTEASFDHIIQSNSLQTMNPADVAFDLAGAAIDMAGKTADAAINAALTTAGLASKYALEMVEEIFNPEAPSASTTSRQRKEERRKRRSERKEAKNKERGAAQSNSSTSNDDLSKTDKPDRKGKRRMKNEMDPDNLVIHKSLAAVTVEKSWSGSLCDIKTSNGTITINGYLEATQSISLETSNGTVTVEGKLLADKFIKIKSSNGIVRLKGDSLLSNNITIHTSNGGIVYPQCMEGKEIDIKTKNAAVQLGNVSLSNYLSVKTANAPVEVHINDIHEDAIIDITTSNSSAHVYLPRTFSGKFYVKTSRNKAHVISKSEGAELSFETNEDAKKVGFCRNLGNKALTEVTVKSSNAPVYLYI